VWELGAQAVAEPVAADRVCVLLTAAEFDPLEAALGARCLSLARTGAALAAARRAGSVEVPDAPELPPSLRAAETFSKSLPGVPRWVGLLAMLEDYADAWDDPAGMPRRAEDRVYVRDGWRCRTPGCTSRRGLEAHHILYRCRGGSDDESNLVTLCALCRYRHKAHHADCRIMPRRRRWGAWIGARVTHDAA
jgi:hypothetical protein